MSEHLSFEEVVARLTEEAPEILAHALGTGGDYADLFYECTVHHRLSWRQRVARGRLDVPVQEEDRQVVEGAGLRALRDEQAGCAATATLSQEALKEAAEHAAGPLGPRGAARRVMLPEAPPVLFELPGDAPDAVAVSEKAALVQAAAEAAFALDARVGRVAVDYHDRVRRTLLASSEGILHAAATSLLGLRVEVTLASERGEVTAHAVAGGPVGFGHFFAQPPEQVAREAVTRAQRLAEAMPVQPGVWPVVLAGGWGGVWLHEAIGHLLEADAVAAGTSPFTDRLGRPVAAAPATLVDDATLAGGRATYAFDDEGTPARRTVLVENGVLRGLLTDRRHARSMGLPRTGNGRRQDYRHPPLPRMTNLVLCAGEADPAALLADVRKGLFVKAVGHGVVQPGGAFSFEVLEGYRIERGRVTVPVAGARIAGTGSEVLRAVAGVGSDLQVEAARGLCRKAGQVVPVSVGMPTVLIQGLQVEAER